MTARDHTKSGGRAPRAKPPSVLDSRLLTDAMARARTHSNPTDSLPGNASIKAAGDHVRARSGETKPKAKVSTRENKRGLVLYLEPDTGKALRLLAITQDMSVQAAGLLALSLLFSHFGCDVPSGLPGVDGPRGQDLRADRSRSSPSATTNPSHRSHET